MDSLKIPKGGGGSRSSGSGSSSIPMAIRFNAGEESVEDVLKPNTDGDSLSSSPQQSSEDFSWRKDFLQGSFFNRKRSGSIEGGISPGSSLISNLSSSDTNTVGTWKLIKGKVSQAMGDIKSSKTTSQSSKADIISINDDSDVETATINSSMSDELSLDLTVPVLRQPKLSQNDSDSDIDDGILDIETTSKIRKSFANLRSKTATTGMASKTPASVVTTVKKSTPIVPKKDESPSRTGFLRKRRKDKESSAGSTSPIPRKKDVEIESGIEMLEDMILPAGTASATTTLNNNETADFDLQKLTGPDLTAGSSTILSGDPNYIRSQDSTVEGNEKNAANSTGKMLKQVILTVYKSRSIVITLLLLGTFLLLPLPDFFRGVLACLFTISTFSSIAEIIGMLFERINIGGAPEKSLFKIPDYSKMPICEIPAAEEHKSLKSYSGWMNEINNYDPSNYHISMTRPVFIRLDGSILRISNTSNRVPKRSMWNEQLIDKKSVIFTRNRCFNLLGCRVEMCPRGLARKRHFSRKYPIQLIVKTSETMKTPDEDIVGVDTKRHSSPADRDIAGITTTTNLTATLAGGPISSSSTDLQTIPSTDTVQHQNSNESNDERSDLHSDLDFGSAILNSDLQKLQDSQESGGKETVPCGDETRLLLFARCDREKEDWYRRFGAASIGAINDQELRIPDIVMMTDEEIASAIRAVPTPPLATAAQQSVNDSVDDENESAGGDPKNRKREETPAATIPYEGLLMTTNAARNPQDYVKFMSKYQNACRTQTKIPIIKVSDQSKRNRRQKKQEDELWKGIDQTLYLGPSGSVVWANVLIGRVLFGCLNDRILLEKIQEFLQKKLSAIKLPSFMEDVVIAQTHLGDTPPLIHRVSQPVLDERGTWIDADVTYEGLMHMTITTKLNLLRLKRQQQQQQQHHHGSEGGSATPPPPPPPPSSNSNSINNGSQSYLPATESFPTTTESGEGSPTVNCAIYDSNAESSGASSSESESPTMGTIDTSVESSSVNNSPQTYAPGSSRRLLRIVDRITASNLFQSATEISYIQRAMENMSTKITLRVELKGLVARVVLNFPPPPSDRIWIAFRGPPRLWISAKPAVGDHTFDWSIVTNVIESKLCEEVYKYLVYPNMVDIIAPFLGQSTYKE